jgi:hypothetical protein
LRSGYRIRVGKLDIRCPNRWFSWSEDVQIIELDAVDRILSPEMTALIALFEDAIKLGHPILCSLEHCCFMEGFPEVVMLCRRLVILLNLFITVGAAICEHEGIVPQEGIEWLSTNMSWVHESLLQEAVEKAQQLDFRDAINGVGGFPGPTSQQIKVVRSWAWAMNNAHGEDMDRVMWNLTETNFQLQLKRFEE